MLVEDEAIETKSVWEWKVPLGLLICGLAILVIHGLATEGARGGATMLLGIALVLLIYLPITIAAMFIAAPLVDVTLGEFGPAIVKIAGIYVFTFAIQDVVATMVHPALGWIVGLGASLALFSKAFKLTLGEAVKAVFVIGVVRGLLALAIASMLPHPAGDQAPAPSPRPAAGPAARQHPRSMTSAISLSREDRSKPLRHGFPEMTQFPALEDGDLTVRDIEVAVVVDEDQR